MLRPEAKRTKVGEPIELFKKLHFGPFSTTNIKSGSVTDLKK